MAKRIGWLLVAVFVGLAILPPALAQVSQPEPRRLTYVALADVKAEDVRFRNHAQGIDLAGMLFLPEGTGPFPAVVVIHGSGTSRRDNGWYLKFTSLLQKNGVAVLLPDKRGSELSGGDWHTASFDDLATDTLAAVDFLRTTYPDKIAEIGVLGVSQGGQIVPIAATQSDEIAFAVNLAGSAVPFHDALVYEEVQNLRGMGLLPGYAHAIAHASSFIIRTVTQRDFWQVIGNYDPLPYWAEVDVPALVLYGEEDTQTPSAVSAARLNSLQNPNLKVVVYPGSGHSLEDPVGVGTSSFRQDALDELLAVVERSVGAK